MAIEFDINSGPPARAVLTAAREHAARERAILRTKNKRFLVYFVTIVLSLLLTAVFGVIPHMNNPEVEPTVVAVAAYFTPYLIFPVFVIGNHLHIKHIEKPAKKLDATLTALEESTPEELSEASSAWHAHDTLTAYQRKVAEQGRALVRGEVAAMQKWIEKHTPVE